MPPVLQTKPCNLKGPHSTGRGLFRRCLAFFSSLASTFDSLIFRVIAKDRPPDAHDIGPLLDGDLEVIGHTHREKVEPPVTDAGGANLLVEIAASTEHDAGIFGVFRIRSHRHQTANTDMDHRVDLFDQM